MSRILKFPSGKLIADVKKVKKVTITPRLTDKQAISILADSFSEEELQEIRDELDRED